MARKASKPADPRRAAVEALMALAAVKPYDQITLSEIAAEAGLSLADLRDHFPSKGSMLAGFLRIIDRQVLEGSNADMAGETTHDRVLDVMMRRFDALAPYKAGLVSVRTALRRDPLTALAFNQAALNSWRYMLEAAGVETEGPLGALRTQGAGIVFARAFEAWVDDETDLSRTMAALDRELKRGGEVVRQAEALERLAAPFRGFARALCQRSRERAASRRGGWDDGRETATPAT